MQFFYVYPKRNLWNIFLFVSQLNEAFLFLLILNVIVNNSIAQITKDTASCSCTASVNISYPKGVSGINGTVVVECDVDTLGFYSNVIIVQSLGKLFDEEALRVANKMSILHNNCLRKCKVNVKRMPKKLGWPFTFLEAE